MVCRENSQLSALVYAIDLLNVVAIASHKPELTSCVLRHEPEARAPSLHCSSRDVCGCLGVPPNDSGGSCGAAAGHCTGGHPQRRLAPMQPICTEKEPPARRRGGRVPPPRRPPQNA